MGVGDASVRMVSEAPRTGAAGLGAVLCAVSFDVGFFGDFPKSNRTQLVQFVAGGLLRCAAGAGAVASRGFGITICIPVAEAVCLDFGRIVCALLRVGGVDVVGLRE